MIKLNLPILDKLDAYQHILIAGMGGGFDVFCGLPIYFELQGLGKQVHLANFSFSFLGDQHDALNLSETVVGITADHRSWYQYFPELYLTQWFREVQHEEGFFGGRRGNQHLWGHRVDSIPPHMVLATEVPKEPEEVTLWCFHKTGVRPLLESYQALVKHLGIDGIILIDGGVDSLLRGNETEIGTLLEDSLSLCAVQALREVPYKVLACLGFGAELEMTYAQVLENMAALTKNGSFLGSCSLLKQMEGYQRYEDAVRYVHDKPQQEPSVINASVVSAMRGEFGDYHLTSKTRGSRLWISPLMPIYWFFDLKAMARRNLLLPELRYTDTMSDAVRALVRCTETLAKRKPSRIPLG